MPKKGDSKKIGRDAGTGQFIPVREAERRKKTASAGAEKSVVSPKYLFT